MAMHHRRHPPHSTNPFTGRVLPANSPYRDYGHGHNRNPLMVSNMAKKALLIVLSFAVFFYIVSSGVEEEYAPLSGNDYESQNTVSVADDVADDGDGEEVQKLVLPPVADEARGYDDRDLGGSRGGGEALNREEYFGENAVSNDDFRTSGGRETIENDSGYSSEHRSEDSNGRVGVNTYSERSGHLSMEKAIEEMEEDESGDANNLEEEKKRSGVASLYRYQDQMAFPRAAEPASGRASGDVPGGNDSGDFSRGGAAFYEKHSDDVGESKKSDDTAAVKGSGDVSRKYRHTNDTSDDWKQRVIDSSNETKVSGDNMFYRKKYIDVKDPDKKKHLYHEKRSGDVRVSAESSGDSIKGFGDVKAKEYLRSKKGYTDDQKHIDGDKTNMSDEHSTYKDHSDLAEHSIYQKKYTDAKEHLHYKKGANYARASAKQRGDNLARESNDVKAKEYLRSNKDFSDDRNHIGSHRRKVSSDHLTHEKKNLDTRGHLVREKDYSDTAGHLAREKRYSGARADSAYQKKNPDKTDPDKKEQLNYKTGYNDKGSSARKRFDDVTENSGNGKVKEYLRSSQDFSLDQKDIDSDKAKVSNDVTYEKKYTSVKKEHPMINHSAYRKEYSIAKEHSMYRKEHDGVIEDSIPEKKSSNMKKHALYKKGSNNIGELAKRGDNDATQKSGDDNIEEYLKPKHVSGDESYSSAKEHLVHNETGTKSDLSERRHGGSILTGQNSGDLNLSDTSENNKRKEVPGEGVLDERRYSGARKRSSYKEDEVVASVAKNETSGFTGGHDAKKYSSARGLSGDQRSIVQTGVDERLAYQKNIGESGSSIKKNTSNHTGEINKFVDVEKASFDGLSITEMKDSENIDEKQSVKHSPHGKNIDEVGAFIKNNDVGKESSAIKNYAGSDTDGRVSDDPGEKPVDSNELDEKKHSNEITKSNANTGSGDVKKYARSDEKGTSDLKLVDSGDLVKKQEDSVGKEESTSQKYIEEVEALVEKSNVTKDSSDATRTSDSDNMPAGQISTAFHKEPKRSGKFAEKESHPGNIVSELRRAHSDKDSPDQKNADQARLEFKISDVTKNADDPVKDKNSDKGFVDEKKSSDLNIVKNVSSKDSEAVKEKNHLGSKKDPKEKASSEEMGSSGENKLATTNSGDLSNERPDSLEAPSAERDIDEARSHGDAEEASADTTKVKEQGQSGNESVEQKIGFPKKKKIDGKEASLADGKNSDQAQDPAKKTNVTKNSGDHEKKKGSDKEFINKENSSDLKVIEIVTANSNNPKQEQIHTGLGKISTTKEKIKEVGTSGEERNSMKNADGRADEHVKSDEESPNEEKVVEAVERSEAEKASTNAEKKQGGGGEFEKGENGNEEGYMNNVNLKRKLMAAGPIPLVSTEGSK